MLFGLVKGAVKSTLFLAAIVAVGGSYAYYKVAAGKLPVPEGFVVTAGLCRTTPSISGGTLPITFEAYVKDSRGHNFLASGGAAGLVKARFEWSHGRFEWVEDEGFAERQAGAAAERRKLAARDVEPLIGDLRSDDPIAREVSAKELFLRTGQTLGYAYDLPKESRDQAAAAWEKWWADDRNRARYTGKRILDGGQKVLDTLRRALGEGGEEER